MVFLFERLKANALMRGMLVNEQNGFALLNNNIGVQRLADDTEGLFPDGKFLLLYFSRLDRFRFRLRSFCRLRFGPCLRPQLGLRLRSDLRFCFRLWKIKGLLRRRRLGARQLHRRGQHRLLLLRHGLLCGLAAVFGCLHGLIEAGLRRLDDFGLCLRLRCGLLLFLRRFPFRAASRSGKRGQNGIVYRIEDLTLGQELDLRFGRMNVHVHSLHRHVNFQHAGRKAAYHDLVAVRLFHGGGEQTGLDIAVVDEEALPCAVSACGSRLCDKAAHAKLFPAAVNRQHIVGKFPAVDGVDRGHAVALSVGVQLLLAVLQKAEGDLRVCQRLLLHNGENSGGLRRVGFHKLHPRRRIVK